MKYSIPQFLLLGALTFIFVGVLTPLMRKIALKVGAVDAPNLARKSQKEPVPYLGGVAIMITVSIIVLGGSLFLKMDGNTSKIVLAIMVPSVLIGLVGLADDLKNLSPISRFIAQTIAALFT